MLRTLFVALDGSALAEQALVYAERLAEATIAAPPSSQAVPV
jgi:hypothetical protein